MFNDTAQGFIFSDVKIYIDGKQSKPFFPLSFLWIKRESETSPCERQDWKERWWFSKTELRQKRGKYVIYHAENTTVTETKTTRQFMACMVANKICSKNNKSIVHL